MIREAVEARMFYQNKYAVELSVRLMRDNAKKSSIVMVLVLFDDIDLRPV